MTIEFFTELIINSNAIRVISVVLLAILIQIVSRIVFDHVARRLIRRHKYATAADEKKREDTLSSIFRTLSGIVIWISALIISLTLLEVDVAALLTGAGLIGIIVGFGAQNTIKDFLAGIFIIVENQYRVGDIVMLQAGGKEVAGVVEELTARITRLRDLDGNLHIVKNGSAEVITNLSFRYANVNINLDVAYDADIDEVEKVVNQVGANMISDDSELKKHIYEPIQFLRVDSFEASSVRIKALGKVAPAKQWEISGAFLRQIKVAFKKNGIEIPFNQVVVRHPQDVK